MLQKMQKVQVIGPKKDLQSVVDVLYHTGTVHLEDVSKTILPGDTTLRRMDTTRGGEMAPVLLKIGGIFLTLPTIEDDKQKQAEIYAALQKKSQTDLIARANEVVTALESTTKDLATKKTELEYTLNALDRYEKIITKILPLENQLPVLKGFEITVILIQREFRDVLDLVRNTLADITRNQFEMISADVDEATIASVIIFNMAFQFVQCCFQASGGTMERKSIAVTLPHLSYLSSLAILCCRSGTCRLFGDSFASLVIQSFQYLLPFD